MFHHDQLMDTCASSHTTPLYCGHFCVVEKRVTFSLLVFLVENMTFIVRVNMISGIFSLWRSPGNRTLASADKQETCPAHSLFLRHLAPQRKAPQKSTPQTTAPWDLPLRWRGCSFPRDSFGESLLECWALILLIIPSPYNSPGLTKCPYHLFCQPPSCSGLQLSWLDITTPL